MATVTKQFDQQFRERVSHLASWARNTLEIRELRTAAEIDEACTAFVNWARKEGDSIDEALCLAWEGYMELTVEWAKDGDQFNRDLRRDSVQEWSFSEFALAACLTFAERAQHHLETGSDRSIAIPAMHYGDAVEAQATWILYRSDSCRQPIPAVVEAKELLREREDAITVRAARKLLGEKAVAVKLAQDASQTARADAHLLWQDWQAGKTLHKNQRAFCDFVADKTGLKDRGNIAKWVRVWSKEKG